MVIMIAMAAIHSDDDSCDSDDDDDDCDADDDDYEKIQTTAKITLMRESHRKDDFDDDKKDTMTKTATKL
jgi:hypothetical protein